MQSNFTCDLGLTKNLDKLFRQSYVIPSQKDHVKYNINILQRITMEKIVGKTGPVLIK